MASITHATQVVVPDDSNYPVGSDEWNADHINKLAGSNLVFYVRTDGSDSNTGLANTAGGAFLTIQHAVDVVCSYDYEGLYYPTINVADGTYNEGAGVRITQPLNTGGDEPTLVGNVTTQANVIVTATGYTFSFSDGGDEWRLKGFTLNSSGNGGVSIADGSSIYFDQLTFGTSGNDYAIRVTNGAAARVDSGGGNIRVEYTDSRGFVLAQRNAYVILSFMDLTIVNAWTVTGTLNHDAFLYARQGSNVYFEGATITGGGNVTGRKYYVAEGTTFEGVNEFGSSAITLDGLPGTTAGYRDWSVHERVALGGSDLSQNDVLILDAITGSNPSINAHGVGTNIGLTFNAKGSPTPAYTFNMGADSSSESRFVSTNASGNGTKLTVYNNSASPDPGDFAAQLTLASNDGSGNKTDYATLISEIITNTNGAEDGQLDFFVIRAGSLAAARMRLGAGLMVGTGATTDPGNGAIIATATVKTMSTTFTGLPSAATAGSGARAFITDCNTATFLATAAAGGSNKVPVVSDGTNWLVG
jgi:hypothetical protein